jgi:hypothetical protein
VSIRGKLTTFQFVFDKSDFVFQPYFEHDSLDTIPMDIDILKSVCHHKEVIQLAIDKAAAMQSSITPQF